MPTRKYEEPKPPAEKKYANDPHWHKCSNEQCGVYREEPLVKRGDRCSRCGKGTFR